MDFSEKVFELCEILDKSLLSRISKKCIYLDLPYHFNIGDTLIWEGTEMFLKSNNISCTYRASCDTYTARNISHQETILLHGGGNFGDLWTKHQNFRLRIISEFPNNNIIILPQTVFYKDLEKAVSDGLEMGKHPNLTICARDTNSYDFLKKYFKNNQIILVPDMAFYIPEARLRKYCTPAIKESLFLKRTDKELKDSDLYKKIVPENSDIRDWPSMESTDNILSLYYKIQRLNKKIGGKFLYVTDWYCQKILKKHLIKIGVKFVSEYKQVYTTRLHVAILSVLLNKSFVFLDNSYGKNKGFYETWLRDLDNVNFIEEND